MIKKTVSNLKTAEDGCTIDFDSVPDCNGLYEIRTTDLKGKLTTHHLQNAAAQCFIGNWESENGML